jgi:hypothetical protein
MVRKLGGFVQTHFLRSIKVRNRSVFLIFVLLLASYSSFAQRKSRNTNAGEKRRLF